MGAAARIDHRGRRIVDRLAEAGVGCHHRPRRGRCPRLRARARPCGREGLRDRRSVVGPQERQPRGRALLIYRNRDGTGGGSGMVMIEARYNGPRDSGNGGWSAGTFAALVDRPAGTVVTLRLPPPLEKSLSVVRE